MAENELLSDALNWQVLIVRASNENYTKSGPFLFLKELIMFHLFAYFTFCTKQ